MTSPFTWRRTFPGTHHDFLASVEAGAVGRINRRRPGGSSEFVWCWTASGILPSLHLIGPPTYGEVPTRQEAIAALTDAYERGRAWSERTGRPFIRPPVQVPERFLLQEALWGRRHGDG